MSEFYTQKKDFFCPMSPSLPTSLLWEVVTDRRVSNKSLAAFSLCCLGTTDLVSSSLQSRRATHMQLLEIKAEYNRLMAEREAILWCKRLRVFYEKFSV